MNYQRNIISKLSQVLMFIAILIASTTVYSKTDLVFLVDGSGSIDATDWQIQKDGIVAALNDPLVLPIDGTVGVAIIQWSTTTRVEFPYQLISTASDRDAAVTAVGSMVQMGENTGPGEGIVAGTVHLEGPPLLARADADQSFCLSTDGTTNTGVDLYTAIDGAVNSSFVLDKFSVIGIEDLPYVTGQDLIDHYGPHVFGGGTVFVVKNATEFANTIGALCLGQSLKLVGIEVTQAVQDLKTSVKLIENKDTLVRVYLEPDPGPDPVKAVARLRGYDSGGIELIGSPLTSVNTGLSITATPDALSRRANMDDSLNFRLPKSWTTGTITLEVEAVGGSLTCEDATPPTANDCMADATFNPDSEVEVKLVRVKYEDGGSTIEPTSTDLTELEQRLLAIYPTASVDRISGSTDMGAGEPSTSEVLTRLKTMRTTDNCGSSCQRIYYGVLDQAGSYSDGWGGMASGSYVSTGIKEDGDTYGKNRHAHELAHNLGRPHTVELDPATSDMVGPCGSSAASDAETFPNIFDISGTMRATLGPMESGDVELVFGWDSLDGTILNPNDTWALMSYCTPGARWVSDHNFEMISTALNSRFTVSAADTVTVTAAGDYLLVRGTIDLDTNVVHFNPFVLARNLVSPQQPTTGEFLLQMKDGAGAVIAEIPFAVELMHPDIDDPDPNAGVSPPNVGLFLIPVEMSSALKQAVVSLAGVELASLVASPNAPTVEVVYPNGGETLTGTVDIQWNGNDIDGDTLTYMVQFSSDGGTTWNTLVVDHPTTNLTVDVNELAQTSNGVIRVTASDGFNTADDVSDVFFTTPNSTPNCIISQPVEGAEFASVQPIYFQAVTYDVEDGTVDDISWTSDLNGLLGTGNDLVRTADELDEGTHNITMTCTDSGGATDNDSVLITVCRVAPCTPPVAEEQTFSGEGDGSGGSGSVGPFELLLGLFGLSFLFRNRSQRKRSPMLPMLAVLFTLVTTGAFAQDGNWYMGAGFGIARTGVDDDDLDSDLADLGYTTSSSVDDTDYGWKLFGGYRFNQYLGVEGSYVDLGDVTSEITVTNDPAVDYDEFVADAVTVHPYSVTGLALTGVGAFPVTERISLYAKLGLFWWGADIKVWCDSCDAEASDTANGRDWTGGLGASYNLSNQVGVRAEWERYATDRDDVDFLSVNILYHFL